jgi:hypothetical protein
LYNTSHKEEGEIKVKKEVKVQVYPAPERIGKVSRAVLSDQKMTLHDALNLAFAGARLTIREPGSYKLRVTPLGFFAVRVSQEPTDKNEKGKKR